MKIKELINMNNKNRKIYLESDFYNYFQEHPQEKKYLDIILKNNVEDYKISYYDNNDNEKTINVMDNLKILLSGIDRATFHRNCEREVDNKKYFIEYLAWGC